MDGTNGVDSFDLSTDFDFQSRNAVAYCASNISEGTFLPVVIILMSEMITAN